TPHQQVPRPYLKLISAAFSFFVAGINDGSLGSLIPYIRQGYHIDTNLVAVVYGTTFCGWLLAALSNSHLCQYLDLGALLVLGALLQVLAHALRTWLPPFSLFAVTFFFASLGQAIKIHTPTRLLRLSKRRINGWGLFTPCTWPGVLWARLSRRPWLLWACNPAGIYSMLRRWD
ncbi:bypass of stop codon protein 6, partial [Aspergillus udagawae]